MQATFQKVEKQIFKTKSIKKYFLAFLLKFSKKLLRYLVEKVYLFI